ncbi:AEL201Wp [Eremothecium gossypii ATCC 10895]|uniref:AEL201Wp n=1 Tax=Eremothecium gossypii (strain ATCC 10895 / CBS 109.51 / FGSC 9923 / NRRL Y-1056) TaxID=284811 RepID=Q758G3_EREGS|nr:AEL201Wp [Eremothecium gossypii ATCC 10895]AAS52484.1 AEL201Wp [Eremothecium gossypii ATCC 10895]AEY96783.1 FAEL201Wp [Eremothecium gossypii FDAG1]
MAEVYQSALKSPSVPNLAKTAGGEATNRRRNTRSLHREDNLSLLDLYEGVDDTEEEREEEVVRPRAASAASAGRVPQRAVPRGRQAAGPGRGGDGLRGDGRPLFMHSATTVTSLHTEATSVVSMTTGGTITPTGTRRLTRSGSHCDRYGFKKQTQYVSEEAYDAWWEGYSKYCIRRKHKWRALLAKAGLGLDGDNPDRFPSKSEKLKRYVRKGIPAEWRGNAWWYFARGQEKLNKNRGVYDRLLAKINDPSERATLKDLDVIERDLNRTFPDNVHFQKSANSEQEPPMIRSLRRVLVAFSIYNPKIGYCQSMNFLSGLLLLFMDEEKAFWMLVIITSRYLPGVHNVNLEGVNIDQGVLMLCIKEYLPEFWSRIWPESDGKKASNRNEFLYKLPPMTLCTASWFMSCFIGIVPIETTLRIWDCLFYEESHILFKISLAIIRLSEPEFPQRQRRLKNRDDEDMEVFQVIQTFPKSLLDPNDIFDKVIFRKRIRFNSLNQEEIDRCRKYVMGQRQKLKNYTEIMGDRISDKGRDPRIHLDIINEALSSEEYGFRRNLTGVHWNNSIKERVRQLSKRK